MATSTMTPLAGRTYGMTLSRTGKTRREEWGATSACGLWIYERLEETTTPWVVVFVPTEQEARFGTLARARRWTATYGLEDLARRAQDVIDAGGRVYPPGTIHTALGEHGLLRRIEVVEDPDECAARVARARGQIATIARIQGEAR